MEEKKIQLGELEANLVNDLDNYVNVNKSNGVKITRMGIIRDLIKDFLEGKVLTKDLIELDKENYFYFNKKELLENWIVKAVPEEPSSDFNNYYTVKAVPNNLDSYNAEINSYCYGTDSNRHKGIFIYYFFNIYGANPVPLVFDLKGNELTISLIKLSELKLLINNEEDVKTVEDIVETYKNDVATYKELIVKPEEAVLIGETGAFFNDFTGRITSVIEDYKGRKLIDLTVKYNLNVLGVPEETSSEINSDVELYNPIEDLINSNVAKDKELKDIKKNYVEPVKEIIKEIERVESLKETEEGFNELWEELKQEDKE